MTSDICIIGTDRFWNNHRSPTNEIESISGYINSEWDDEISDGSGDYDKIVTLYYEGGASIPESALRDNGNLDERNEDGDNWLENNESTLYSNSDAIVIVDYYGLDSNTYGWGYIGYAGGNFNLTGLVDTHHEDNGNLPSELSEVESEGVAFHELLHNFSAEHPDDVTTISFGFGDEDVITIMYSWDGVRCSNNGNTELMTSRASNCTINTVRSYIDNHSNL